MTTFEDPWGVLEDHGPGQALQPQSVTRAALGGAHGRRHAAHQLVEQGSDQGGLARGAATKDGDFQVAPFQFGLQALAFLAQGFPLYLITHPIKGLVDGLQVAGGGFPAATGWRLGWAGAPRAAVAAAAPPGQHQLGQPQGQGRQQQQHQGGDQPARQPIAQLPDQLVEALQHGGDQ